MIFVKMSLDTLAKALGKQKNPTEFFHQTMEIFRDAGNLLSKELPHPHKCFEKTQ